MKLKSLGYIVSAFAIVGMLASCSSSSQMASSFGSRKYTKGYFINSAGSANTVAATAKTSVAPTVAAQANTAPHVNIVPVTASNTTGTAALKEQNKQVMPTQTENKKMTLKNAVAMAKQKANVVASPSQSVLANANTEGINKIETTADTKFGHSSGGFDFKAHPVRYILIGLLIIIIVGFLVFAAINGDLGVSAGD